MLPKGRALDDIDASSFAAACRNATKWFASPAVDQKARQLVERTCRFLLDNAESIEKDGTKASSKRWFNNAPYVRMDPDVDFALIDIRRMMLRQQACGFGLFHFLYELLEAELIPSGAEAHFDDATNLAAIMIHYNMVGWVAAKRPGHPLNFEALKPALLYALGNNSSKVRNNWGLPFSTCGLWKAERNGRAWGVGLGDMARLFHTYAFIPAVRTYDRVLLSETPSANRFAPADITACEFWPK
ncbi:hypothetical protein X748_27685 [Mesorhizobium sp. LNJC386A00]|nr:hypothetical protein X748_27685 [Mesorhizobium sp. LNJC386A00]